jgi:hypothetical protein
MFIARLCLNYTTIRGESARSTAKKALLNSSIALKLREEIKEKSSHLNDSDFTENNGVVNGDD